MSASHAGGIKPAFDCDLVEEAKLPKAEESIGVANMRENGTLVLDLRAEGRDGVTGIAQFVYPPSHKDYCSILHHLGSLEPGEKKPVPPWPDNRN